MTKFTDLCFKFWKNRLIFNCKRYYTSQSGDTKICIVGSGPGGFYTASQILKNCNAEIDIYEKLPVPFGLIRYGVAPDHPDIKVVSNSFTEVAQNERCNFFGNVDIGQDIKLSELLAAYNAVILAFGASKDREMGIPGEDSQNVFAARKFVNWYNGHPDHVNDKFDLDVDVATIIGHGNVALDVSRILLKSPDELKNTDIAQHAMDALLKSRIKKVVLIGRRGPLQVSFTIKEFREMTKLEGCRNIISVQDFDGIPELIESLPRPKKRLTQLLYDTATSKEIKKGDKTLEVKFFRSPKSIVYDDQGKVKKMVLGINTIDGNLDNAQVVETGKSEEIESGLVLRSVGYKSLPIDPIMPFDPKRFIVPNKVGKVIEQEGLYCSGWVKTGPVGVIANTMSSSYETADEVLKDMKGEKWFSKQCLGKASILKLLEERGVKFTTFSHWEKIDKVEMERGKAAGKSRQKICSVNEMLQVANIQ